MSNWSNLAKVVYKRTYARKDYGALENWSDTVERVIYGNVTGHEVSPQEIERLRYYLTERKAGPAGRGWWYSGAPSHKKLGGVALNNCWFTAGDDWSNFVLAQDLLMLGGGVGMSVEHRFVSKLPKVKRDVHIVNRDSKDADFIVPDSREGWNELTRRILESYFDTGKSFSYSTVCIRPAGEPISGFGGSSSGPKPLIAFVEKLCTILNARGGKHVKPLDAADILCSIAEMVVAGNVRRSAIIILGDPWDKEYLKAKRWDLGNIPTQRAMANFSVVVDDVDDLHPLFWKTYEEGEPFGIVNRTNMQKYGRMGEEKYDPAIGVNPCLTGDSLVMTTVGEKTIQELAEMNANFEVYSYDEEKQEVVIKNAIAFKTKEDAQIMKLKTKSGKEIKLTPDHRVLTQRGWVEAQNLTLEDKLYKIS
jgi:ribonucleoside-triphosphate reductase